MFFHAVGEQLLFVTASQAKTRPACETWKGTLTCTGAPQRKKHALTNGRAEMTMRNGSVARGLRIRLCGAMRFDAGLLHCEDMSVRRRADTWSKRLSDCGVHGGERECVAGERLGVSCSGMLEQTRCFFVWRLSSFARIRTQHCALLWRQSHSRRKNRQEQNTPLRKAREAAPVVPQMPCSPVFLRAKPCESRPPPRKKCPCPVCVRSAEQHASSTTFAAGTASRIHASAPRT